MPAAMIPRKRLICCDTPVSQLSDESMNADLPPAGFVLVPVVVVLVFSEQTVVGSDIAFEVGVIRTGRMYHDSFRRDGFTRLIAGIVYKNQFAQVHLFILRSVVKLF